MDKYNRVLDQVKPTPEQEQAMLDRLLREQKEVKPVSRMKKMTAVLAAAALLLMACAFTVATGVDQRLLALFRGDEQDAKQIAAGVVSVGESYTYDNGWTVEVEQVLVDRYSLAVLVDLIGPEGTVLNGEDCFVDFASEIIPEDGEGVGSYVSGSTVLEDENPEDNRKIKVVEEWFEQQQLPASMQLDSATYIPDLPDTVSRLFEQSYLYAGNPRMEGSLWLLLRIKKKLEGEASL